MAQVTLTINGRKHDIACDDGQEAHLTRLAEYMDKRLAEMAAAVGPQVGENRLLVMTGLMIADELSDSIAELDDLRKANVGVAALMEAEEGLAEQVESLAERIENIAIKVEQA